MITTRLRPHLQYAGYVLRHKRFVFRAGLRLGVPLWQLVIHDWSKLLPCEWFPYVDFFYGRDSAGGAEWRKMRRHQPGAYGAFDAAWNHHQKVQKHHWQHYILIRDGDEPTVTALPMPEKYAREMVADWVGAGMAQGKDDLRAWYGASRAKIMLHEETRALVERLVEYYVATYGPEVDPGRE